MAVVDRIEVVVDIVVAGLAARHRPCPYPYAGSRGRPMSCDKLGSGESGVEETLSSPFQVQESSHAQSAPAGLAGTRHSESLDTLYQCQDHACGRTYAARAISLVQCGAARTVVGQLQAADVKGGKSAIQGSDLRRSTLAFVLAFARALWSVHCALCSVESEIRILRAAEVRRASDHDALMPIARWVGRRR